MVLTEISPQQAGLCPQRLERVGAWLQQQVMCRGRGPNPQRTQVPREGRRPGEMPCCSPPQHATLPAPAFFFIHRHGDNGMDRFGVTRQV